MAGESYGVSSNTFSRSKQESYSPFSQQGRYIPVFAAEVYDQNMHLIQAGMTPINLTSIMLGQDSLILMLMVA